MKRSSGDNSWVVAPCENSSMPGKIFPDLISFAFNVLLDSLATYSVAFFVSSFGQFLGGLGLTATSETVLVGEI